MAEKSISYGIGLSDQMINQMLQSNDPSIVAQAQDYINQAQAQQEQKPNLLQRIGNFFISPAASAEVVMNPQGNLVDTEGNINFFNGSINYSNFFYAPFIKILHKIYAHVTSTYYQYILLIWIFKNIVY